MEIKKMIITKINKVAFLQLKKKIELFSPEFFIGETSNLKVFEVLKNAKKVARFDYKNESILICDNCVAFGRDGESWQVFVDQLLIFKTEKRKKQKTGKKGKNKDEKNEYSLSCK